MGDPLGERPLQNLEHDVLGYAPFALHLSEALADIEKTDGLVLALHGSWGAGKSTVLNFTETYLKRQPALSQPKIIRFNPWWFSGQEDLTRAFFEELIGGLQLNASSEVKEFVRDKVAPLLRIFGKAVSKLPVIAVPGAASIGEALYQTGEELQKLGLDTLTKAKERIEQELKQVASKILIIIDDIDRLTAEEIRQMFRLIKAVANFDNITYLLAFDRRVVAAALGDEQVSGEDYLAKIVQIAFELPLPDRDSLEYMLEQRLKTIVAKTPDELFEPWEWSRAYRDRREGADSDGIRHFLETPRDVVRLANFVRLTYPPVRDEVNAVDFISLETLRLHSPAVYDVIRRNEEYFRFDYSWAGMHGRRAPPGSVPPGLGLDSSTPLAPPPPDPKMQEFHETWQRKLMEQGKIGEADIAPIKRLLTQMFPRLDNVLWADVRRVPELEAAPRPRARGICYKDLFPYYFRLAPPQGGISRGEALEAASDIDKFRAELATLAELRAAPAAVGERQWLGRPLRVQALLTWLDENTEVVPEANAGPIFQAILEQADLDQYHFLLGKLLGRVPPESRFALLSSLVETQQLEQCIKLVRELASPFLSPGATPPPANWIWGSQDQPLITTQQLADLRSFTLQKMEQAARENDLAQVRDLRFVLGAWNAWGDNDFLGEWGREQIEKNLVGFFERFARETYIRSPPGGRAFVPEAHDFILRPRWFTRFINLPDLMARIRDLDRSALTERQGAMIDAMVAEYEHEQQLPKENPFTD
jgi:predicted KAP-like P-loop ATPase